MSNEENRIMTEEENTSPPDCPKCGSPMEQRLAKREPNYFGDALIFLDVEK